MSALSYYEPHKMSAGALALVVHVIFFALLFFGINWRVNSPQPMVVEMWERLPEPVPPLAAVVPVIEPVVVAPKIAERVVPLKADIELKDKKLKKVEAKKPTKAESKVAARKAEKTKQQELDKQRALQVQLEQIKRRSQEEQLAREKLLEQEKQRAVEERSARENERIQELKAKMRAETDAALQGEVAKYKDLIQAKIRRNIVMPPDVSEGAEAKFMVIVLPGGSVADVNLISSSGNAAYDSAAERAIFKAQPLPLPQDASLARMFRELRLTVKP